MVCHWSSKATFILHILVREDVKLARDSKGWWTAANGPKLSVAIRAAMAAKALCPSKELFLYQNNNVLVEPQDSPHPRDVPG